MDVNEASAEYLTEAVPQASGDEVPPGYQRTEVGVIPKDWKASTVGAEFTIQLGKMLDSEKNTGVSKPFLGNRSVQWGQVDVNDLSEIRLTPTDLQRTVSELVTYWCAKVVKLAEPRFGKVNSMSAITKKRFIGCGQSGGTIQCSS